MISLLKEKRVRAAAAAALVGLGAIGAAGCGNKIELPTETRGGTIPPANAYRVTQIWLEVPDAFDILLTEGNLIFISEPDSGRVRGYFRSRATATPNGIEITGLSHPTYIAEGVGGRILVADATADTSGTLTNWKVLEYSIDVQPPRLVNIFRDASWNSLRSIEADGSGNLFVSTIFVKNRRGDLEDRVIQYAYADSLTWVREATQGTGTDFVTAPNGLAYDPGGALFAVDANWVRRWTLSTPGVFKTDPGVFTDGASEGGYSGARDVAVDGGGNFYVADTGGGRVLKYDPGTVFDLRVDEGVASASEPGHLVRPQAIAVNTTQVYAVDGADGKVVTFELN